jgi:hypothetical protein
MSNQVLVKPRKEEITVSIASTPEEIQQGMKFCGRIYKKTYGTYWEAAPDILFIARENEKIIGTAGLEIAVKHEKIGAEKYFYLSKEMQDFINNNREHVAEFGRFSSLRSDAARALLHAVISYCQKYNYTFLLAWANPSVFNHGTKNLGVPFWNIDVPLNTEAALNDKDWVTPPKGFFIRKDPPQLLLSVIPFWTYVNEGLSKRYGKPLTI